MIECKTRKMSGIMWSLVLRPFLGAVNWLAGFFGLPNLVNFDRALTEGMNLTKLFYGFPTVYILTCMNGTDPESPDDIHVIVKATGAGKGPSRATVTLDREMSIREVKKRITGAIRGFPQPTGTGGDDDFRIILAGRELDDNSTVGEIYFHKVWLYFLTLFFYGLDQASTNWAIKQCCMQWRQQLSRNLRLPSP